VSHCGKAGHVAANLGDENLGDTSANAWNSVQQLDHGVGRL
jgi:hypothetical protein